MGRPHILQRPQPGNPRMEQPRELPWTGISFPWELGKGFSWLCRGWAGPIHPCGIIGMSASLSRGSSTPFHSPLLDGVSLGFSLLSSPSLQAQNWLFHVESPPGLSPAGIWGGSGRNSSCPDSFPVVLRQKPPFIPILFIFLFGNVQIPAPPRAAGKLGYLGCQIIDFPPISLLIDTQKSSPP